MPFDQHPIAVIKTTDKDTDEETYYANGNHAEIRGSKISELASRESNEIFFFDKKFSTVDPVSLDYTVNEPNPIRHFYYYDTDGNRYDESPAVSDPDLLAIEKDFLEQVYELHDMNVRIFRDGNTLYVSTFCGCGFGSSARLPFRYDMPSRKLSRIGQLKDKEITGWFYSLSTSI